MVHLQKKQDLPHQNTFFFRSQAFFLLILGGGLFHRAGDVGPWLLDHWAQLRGKTF